jgi:hypothetical protein
MRNVFFAGLGLAFVYAVVNFAIKLLNIANDWSILAGYLLLLTLVSALSNVLYRIWRRL